MLEISKQSLAAIGKRELTNIMYGEYSLNKKMIEHDIELLKGHESENEQSRKAIWTLEKLRKFCNAASKIGIKIGYNEDVGCFDTSGIELTCTAGNAIDGDADSIYEEIGNCSARYLADDKHKIFIIDYRELLDVIAFEYAINNFDLDVHAINVWLKDSNMYGTNNIEDITKMLREEVGIESAGDLYMEVMMFKIDSMCPRLTVTGDCINTFVGNRRIGIKNKDKRKDRKFLTVLKRSADEVLISAIGELSKTRLAGKIKVIAVSEIGRMAIYADSEITKKDIEEEATAVIRLLNKRYKITPVVEETTRD